MRKEQFSEVTSEDLQWEKKRTSKKIVFVFVHTDTFP